MSENQISIGFVLWCGHLGGAERLTLDLVSRLRSEHGVDARVLYVEEAGRSGAVCEELGVPYREMCLSRGSAILTGPRRFAEAIRATGSDIAFLQRGGFMARAARLGGYQGALVSIEHGGILQISGAPLKVRVKEAVSRFLGESCLDATVCVSNFVRGVIEEHRHAKRVEVIYNGVDTEVFHPGTPPSDQVIFGHAGRLIEGKGILQLVRAFDPGCVQGGARLLIAGDGPSRSEAEAVIADRGIGDAVEFLGVVDDIAGFWRRCSVGVHVTHSGWRESFCLSIVEAMSSGLPVIVSDEGALPEIVGSECGCIVQSPNVPLLADALCAYANDADRRTLEGGRGRARVLDRFDIARVAAEYLELARELVRSRL